MSLMIIALTLIILGCPFTCLFTALKKIFFKSAFLVNKEGGDVEDPLLDKDRELYSRFRNNLDGTQDF